MKNAFLLFLIIVCSASLTGCDEDITDVPAKPSENSNDVDAMPFKSDSVDVLIAGAVSSSEGQWRACYWRNDSILLLEEQPSIANDVLVVNEEVVAAGKYDGKPCVWRNGERTLLDTQRYGEVKAIGLMNGKLYLVGELYETQTNFRAFMWTEGKMTFLNDYKGYASDIAISGKDIYISGMDSEKPCYWKNGLKTELSSHFGHGYGIEVIGNDVFVGGEYRPSGGGYFLAGFWKNGFFQSPSGNSCYVWGIGINKEKVVLVGATTVNDNTDNAVKVVDDKIVTLSAPGNIWSGANDISFNNDDEYVLGSITDKSAENRYSRVCYWLNGALHEVSKHKSVGKRVYLKPVI